MSTDRTRTGLPIPHRSFLACLSFTSGGVSFHAQWIGSFQRATYMSINSHVACNTTAKLRAESGRKFLWFSQVSRVSMPSHTIHVDGMIYYQFLPLAHSMHVFLVIPRMALSARIIFIEAVVVVDAIDVESSRDLAQCSFDFWLPMRNAICHWRRRHCGLGM